MKMHNIMKPMTVLPLLMLIVSLCASVPMNAQCYQKARSSGMEYYNKGKCEEAIRYFEAAKSCPDKPAKNDLDSWIAKCNKCKDKPTPPPTPSRSHYLKVNGMQLDFTTRFPGSGGTEDFTVSTDDNSYKVENLPWWCSVRNKYSSSFQLVCEENKSSSNRSARVLVKNTKGNEIVIDIQQDGKRSRLMVNGKTKDFSISVDGGGGTLVFRVMTDEDNYSVTLLPSWCELKNKMSTSFQIVCEANTGQSARSSSFIVGTPNGDEIEVKVVQGESSSSSYSYGNTALKEGGWRNLLMLVKNNPTQKIDNGDWYKGETNSSGSRSGYGCYGWVNGDIYIGGGWNVSRNGIGIYIIGPPKSEIRNCSGCKYFVGKFDSDKKSGKGTCYDENGNLIYYGEFSDDKPTGTYPSKGSNLVNYKFECINYPSGNKYVGETYYGKRHGKGIFIWKTGDCWYGEWTDGERDGYGVYLGIDGTVTRGKWKGDDKVE